MSLSIPLVTVIVPTYNRAKLLPFTINSILAQTYPHLQVLVIDDGSTDITRSILESYGDRLTWEWQPNRGEAAATNRGLEQAQGDLIGVVSSDDVLYPNLIAQVVAAAQVAPGALVFYPNWIKIDLHGKPISGVVARPYDYSRMVREVLCLVGPGAFFRRAALTYVSGRNPDYRYVGDFDFWLRLGLHGDFIQIAYVGAGYRVHDESASVARKGHLIGAELIAMMESYFSQSDHQHLRKSSLASTAFLAGTQCLTGDYPAARAYLRRSLRLDPITALRHPQRLVHAVAANLLPAAVHQPLYRAYQRAKTERERASASPH